MLTPRQLEVLTFIDTRIKETGACPSYTEMGQALGITGRNSLHQIIDRLVERGFVRRIPRKARAIEVVRMPGQPFPEQDDVALASAIESALKGAAYLREEADFNRSWTDGRRGTNSDNPGYVARRIELAEERERWADAIEATARAIAGRIAA